MTNWSGGGGGVISLCCNSRFSFVYPVVSHLILLLLLFLYLFFLYFFIRMLSPLAIFFRDILFLGFLVPFHLIKLTKLLFKFPSLLSS